MVLRIRVECCFKERSHWTLLYDVSEMPFPHLSVVIARIVLFVPSRSFPLAPTLFHVFVNFHKSLKLIILCTVEAGIVLE